MRLISGLLTVAMAGALAGCFTAEEPLLTDANSVAPYATITFQEKTNNEETTLTRDASGKSYSVTNRTGGPTTFRFMATDRPSWYVVEVSGGADPGEIQRLYGVVYLDLIHHHADAFKTVGDPVKDAGPGLTPCTDLKDAVCITDLKAYVTAAEKYVIAGGQPDASYDITVE